MFGELITHLELQTEGLETNKCHTHTSQAVFVTARLFVSTTAIRKGQLGAFHALYPANPSIRSKSMLESTNQTNLVPPAPVNSAEICWRLTGTRIIRYTAQNF